MGVCVCQCELSGQMSARCKEGEHLDGLTRQCIPCHMVCRQSHVIPRCASYCGGCYIILFYVLHIYRRIKPILSQDLIKIFYLPMLENYIRE